MFSYKINDLRLRASRRNAINVVIVFGEGCCGLETQLCTRQLYRNTLMTDFRMTIITFQMLCDDIALVTQVLPSYSTKSRYFF